MKNPIITILGGSGFVGSYIVRELVKTGAYIKVVSRNPEQSIYLRVTGNVGQLYFQKIDIEDPASIEDAIKDSDVVINLIGILNGSKKQFNYIHTLFPAKLAKCAKELNIKKLIHFSALGATKAFDSVYSQSKYEGEKAALKEFPSAIIIRPSVIFGPGDEFINKFAHLISIFPLLPLFHKGKTKLQPVYAMDIARAVAKIATSNNPKYHGKIFEFAGPRIYSLKKTIGILEEILNKKIITINIPSVLGVILSHLCELLPSKPITADQLKLLRYNNIISKDSLWNLKSLGITASNMENILPHYVKLQN